MVSSIYLAAFGTVSYLFSLITSVPHRITDFLQRIWDIRTSTSPQPSITEKRQVTKLDTPLKPPVMPKEFTAEQQAQLQRLGDWQKSYKTDYVGHGVASAKVSALLADGYLRCSENILHRTGRVEFEGGATKSGREVVYLPNPAVLKKPQNLKKIEDIVTKCFELNDGQIKNLLLDWDRAVETRKSLGPQSLDEVADLSKPVQEQESLPSHVDLINSNYLTKVYAYQRWLRGIAKQFPQLWNENQRPRYVYEEPLIAICIDKLLPKEKRFKAQLQKISQMYNELKQNNSIKMSLVDICEELAILRKWRLGDPLKLNSDIRVDKNSKGRYGNVKVVIGGSEPLIGSLQMKDTGEYHLLSQGQNGGKFLKIDLSAANVLIVGPRAILSDYAQDPRFGKNILFKEVLLETNVHF